MSNTACHRLSARYILSATFIASVLPFLMLFLLFPDPHRAIDKGTYLLFHNVTEFFSIMVSLSVFSVGWYTFEQSKDRRALFVGTGFLVVGLFDFMHTMSIGAMPDFITANSLNKNTQFWIAARLVDASTLLASAFVSPDKKGRRISRPGMLAGAALLTGSVFTAVVFFPDQVPATAVAGSGLTPLKRCLELVVIALLSCSFLAYLRRFRQSGDRNLLYFLAAFIVCIFSEAVFASYRHGSEILNVLGHIYKLVAFYLIYKGIFASAVQKPYLALSEANEKLLRLNRLYGVLSETNKSIVRATDRCSLFHEICRVAVGHGGLTMAWIGVVDEKTGIVEPVACSGKDEGFLELLRIRPGPEMETVTGAAIRERSLKICGDIVGDNCAGQWRHELRARGYLSCAAIALESNGRTVGALTMYAADRDFFGTQLADLLSQMASDISFALTRLEGESRRQEVERALQEEILERVRVMEALHEKDQLLNQQSRLAAIGEMINNIAHQWRQPLNVVGLIVQELRLRQEKGGLSREFFDLKVADLMNVLQHMSQTIDDFRTFFRPLKQRESFRVGQAVGRVSSLIDGSFRDLGIELGMDLSEDTLIHGYPNEYSQVLLNILINARDAFRERAPKGPRRVVISAFSESDGYVLVIADNAGGIPREILHKVFDPYFTTKGPDEGTGLGLYMSKSIIEKSMKGRLTVCNRGGGAEFRIEVPSRVSAASPAGPGSGALDLAANAI